MIWVSELTILYITHLCSKTVNLAPKMIRKILFDKSDLILKNPEGISKDKMKLLEMYVACNDMRYFALMEVYCLKEFLHDE